MADENYGWNGDGNGWGGSGNILFTNVRVLDAMGDYPYTGEVLIQGNRIKQITRGSSRFGSASTASTGATVIDGMGATLMPGMIDAHLHLSWNNAPGVDLRAWRPFAILLRDRRVVLTMGLAGLLIFVNWQTYVYATLNGQVVEAALGYFINPIVTVLLGVIVLRERLNPTQWVAVGISVVAVIVLAIGYGQLPWIALVLAFSFGLYGLIKKRVGPKVDAVSGLTLETAWLAPLAVGQLVFVGMTTGLTIGTAGAWHTVLLVSAGAVTAVPLLLFAAASRRLPLIYMGFIQYFAPFIQFLVGVFVLQEPMPPERWIGFGLVWLALIVLTFDLLRGVRASRRLVIEPV